MLIKIGEFECTECWDGVFYKKLANYPVITEWEIQTVLDFEHYEKQNGRDCFIEADLSIDFTSGVRFFFKYDKIVTHPDAIFEGVLPLKVKEEVILSDWVDTIIIPSAEREAFEAIIPYELESRTFFLDNDCKDIWNWSEKVYEFVKNREC